MKPLERIGRRQFLHDSALGLGAGSVIANSAFSADAETSANPGQAQSGSALKPNALMMQATIGSTDKVWIYRKRDSGFPEQFASYELARGLRNLGLAREPVQVFLGEVAPPASGIGFVLSVNEGAFKHPEAYEISHETIGGKASRVRFTGATPQAVLYAVFDFLERQGAFFGLDGEVYPLEPAHALDLPPVGHPWHAQPRFKVRGLVPWPDFLNCVTVYNREDWRAYLEAMVRMRFNTLGVHVYSGENQWVESFLSFEYAGAGHLAYTDTSATNRWGYLPERTSRFGMGAPDFFAGEVFGSEATTKARSCWEAEELAQKLWGEAFQYAKQLGIRTGVGFEPYQVSDEIYRATPPEAHYASSDPKIPGPRIDPESVAAKDILEARLGQLLEAYPTLDYVWLWEDEGMSWASQKQNVPLSVTPFKQAYDFLRRHAPEKRLVISGWGGVVRHFAYFHKALPEEIIFSSLNDNLGWDPVSEEYGKLEGRERWPIPWLEDDPAMWLPQFHVNRFVRDMDLADQYGCQGLLGIHWRHRIMDIDAGFQASYSWNKELTPTKFFQAFASAQAREPRAGKLAQILDETDRDRLVLCSWTGQVKDGHSEIHEYTGDYDEAFQFWNGYDVPDSVKNSQAEVGQQLRALTDAASSPAERERLNYLTRFVEFLTPYSESWSLAFRLNQKLQKASELKRQNKADEARNLIVMEGMPLWLDIAPLVREVFLDYQEIVSTRNDLGQLASMHNKYERLALYRLLASMKEFLGELPPETERLFAEVRLPDPKAIPRAFVPTRPTVLRQGDQVRISAVIAGGGQVGRVTLLTRAKDSDQWNPSPMRLIGRRTYAGEIKWQEGGPLMDYYVQAEIAVAGNKKTLTSPPEAPTRFYTVTVL
ncbi:MAG TPA: hypothetical protein VEO19_05665 [Terriglobia bacterium]|nr:hypothetical protein [Terriglobia bacterium]